MFLLYGFINPEIDVSDKEYMTFVRKSNAMLWKDFDERRKYFEDVLEGIYFYLLDERLEMGSDIVVFGSTFSYLTTYLEARREYGAEVDFRATLGSLPEFRSLIIKGLFRTQEEMWQE